MVRFGRPGRLRTDWGEPVVLAVALITRLWVVLGDGGFGGNFYYDPAVYYAAGDALTHGRLPYADYVLIHPPVIALVNAPLALLGRLTTDHVGFMVGNAAYTVLAAVNAVLVVRVAQAFGASRRAALVAGAFYAVWIGAVTAEFLIRLEPLGNFVLLLALLALAAARRRRHPAAAVLCGALFGTLLSVKIWWVVPVAIVLVWQVVGERARRRAGWMLVGLAGAALSINGPFFVAAGGRMYRAIVTAQLDRASNGVPVHARVDKLSALSQAYGGRFNADTVADRPAVQVLVVLFVALVLAASALALRTAAGRVVVAILAAETVVFLTTPTWFYTYCDYLAVPLALTMAAAATPAGTARMPLRRAGPAVAGALAVFAAITTAATFANGGLHLVPSTTGTSAAAADVKHVDCIVSDTPMALILLNSLDRSVQDGCRNWVDLTGVEHGGGPDPRDEVTRGHRNPRWSADLCRYLTSGDAVVIVTSGSWHSLPAACADRIRRAPVIARAGELVVHRLR